MAKIFKFGERSRVELGTGPSGLKVEIQSGRNKVEIHIDPQPVLTALERENLPALRAYLLAKQMDATQ